MHVDIRITRTFLRIFPRPARILVGLLLANTILVTNSNADLILTAPPRESSELGKAMYEPIAEGLSTLMGELVVYQRPKGWFDYSKNMRNNKYDIVFDGPHFTAWRLKHLDHTPVASLPGKLKFFVVANESDDELKKLHDLVGQKICGILSPNLGTDLVLSQYDNPAIQPIIYSVKGDMLAVFNRFKEGKCRAAILRDIAYDKLAAAQKQSLKIIYKTNPMPNQTITIAPKLKKHRREIESFMTSPSGASASEKLLARYSNKARYFVPTVVKNYRGVEELIEGVVFGW
ncbi:MAG: phosphate/phosphite/phosphonate ABC transporter substrate-binding protein [Thiohalomonadales bacterium]